MRSAILLSALFFASIGAIFAQGTSVSAPEPGPIQDNSFLAEEAYNQEPGVVQHIQTFTRLWNSKTWAYSFTQEWPVPAHWRHQLSYTLVDAKTNQNLDRSFGDLLLNYRYQLLGDGEARLAISPRATLIVPSGSVKNASSYGGTGVQAVLPASLVLDRRFVSHYDLGGTWVPHAHDAAHDRAPSYGYNATGSLIWLAHPRVNGMFETADIFAPGEPPARNRCPEHALAGTGSSRRVQLPKRVADRAGRRLRCRRWPKLRRQGRIFLPEFRTPDVERKRRITVSRDLGRTNVSALSGGQNCTEIVGYKLIGIRAGFEQEN